MNPESLSKQGSPCRRNLNPESERQFRPRWQCIGHNQNPGTIAERAANHFWPTKDSDDTSARGLTGLTQGEPMLRTVSDRNPEAEGWARQFSQEEISDFETRPKIN
jgi:hypothetical protein